MPHVVTDNCKNCRYTDCVASCPVACFHLADDRVYIDPKVCIDCSACIPACPVHAIVESIDLAPDQMQWIEINASESKRFPVISSKLTPLDSADARRKELGY
jgi:ferredoxin